MALDDDVAMLSALPPFEVLDGNALRLIAFSAELRILRTGDVLFRQDEASDAGYVVMSGALVLKAEGGSPGHVVTRGALVGETALVSVVARPATATAREPTTVLKVSQALFRRVLAEYPDATAKVSEGFSTRLANFATELDRLYPLFADDGR